MHAGLALKIEKTLDRAASALFAAACGYAVFAGLAPWFAQPSLGVESAVAAGVAFLICGRVLTSVQPTPRKAPVPIFDVRNIDAFDPSELHPGDRGGPAGAAEEALLLDDILAEIRPDSRVVRLFDAEAMPTPGQLDARIRNRLAGEGFPAQLHDASQALHEALAELRRSLG